MNYKDEIKKREYQHKDLEAKLNQEWYNLPFVARKREKLVKEYKELFTEKEYIEKQLEAIEAEYKIYGARH